MEPNQYILDLPALHSHSMEDFVVGDCNREAANFISAWPKWSSHALILIGPRASGKSHLANVWKGRTGAQEVAGKELTKDMVPDLSPTVIVENAQDTRDWEALLHLYNWIGSHNGHMLLTAELNPLHWNLKLKDLSSRLISAPLVNLNDPDENILGAVMMKQFADRQIVVDPAVVSYLLKRIERSFESVQNIVAKIDQLSLEKKTRITIPLAKKALDQQ